MSEKGNKQLHDEIEKLREENKRLRFIVENGLDPEDLEDDRKGGER